MKHERRQKIEEKVGFEIPRTEVHRQLWALTSICGRFHGSVPIHDHFWPLNGYFRAK